MRPVATGPLVCLLVACSGGSRAGTGELPPATVAPPVLPDECPGGTTQSRTETGASCTQPGAFVAAVPAKAAAPTPEEAPVKAVKLATDWESRAPTCAVIYQYQGLFACPPGGAACKPPAIAPTPCNARSMVAWNRIVETLPLRLRTEDGVRRAEAECALDVRALRRFCN